MGSIDPDKLSAEQKSERLRLVVEGTRLGMWDWNPKTGELHFNDIWCELLGYQFHELEPSYAEWECRVHPDDLQQAIQDLSDHIAGKTAFYQNIHRMKHRDGHWVYILDRGQVVEYDDEGQAIRFTGTHTDITEQKRAEEEAAAASEAKSLFLATMSHEIRTPLNGVLGVLQLLEETPLGTEQQMYVDVIRSSGRLLLTIINDILDFSKIEAGQMTLAPEPRWLEPMLEHVLQVYEAAAREKRVELSLHLAAEVPACIEVDEIRLKQILMNLISNGIKFTEQGSVRLEVDVEGPQLVFRVRDSGKGIADPSRLGKLFAQEDGSITRRYGGTGLGLAICKRLLELMQGSLHIDSEVGVGSTFTVRIPCRPAAPPSALDAEPGGARLRSLRILVAEDNPTNQLVAERMLTRLGMDVTVVGTGAAALQALEDREFDVVLMDIHMPDMDGLEATRRIRARAPERPLPIYALSADVMGSVQEDALAAGMSGFLTKPLEREALIAALCAAV